jgi:drug/metabolite transporter (DMT)-like permease
VWMYGAQVDIKSQLTGTLVALLVPIAGAINWTVVQSSRAHGKNVDLVPAVLVGAMMSVVVTLPLSFPMAATPHDIGLLAVLGVFQLGIPCALAMRCAHYLKAPEVSLLALLEVIFGILLAWLGAGEAPGPNVLSGGLLVIAALLVNELIGWRERA